MITCHSLIICHSLLLLLLISSSINEFSLVRAPLRFPDGPAAIIEILALFGAGSNEIFAPAQNPSPPAIQPFDEEENERVHSMVDRAKHFASRYLSRSDLLHLHRRVIRARYNGATVAQIRRVVWHFLSEALSPEQKTELGMEKRQLWRDFDESVTRVK